MPRRAPRRPERRRSGRSAVGARRFGARCACTTRRFWRELTRARAPFFVNFIALTWVAPTILRYGTEEQKKRMLKPLLRGDEIWCQGFSEPGAGSDLASLSTRAASDGDGWRPTAARGGCNRLHSLMIPAVMRAVKADAEDHS